MVLCFTFHSATCFFSIYISFLMFIHVDTGIPVYSFSLLCNARMGENTTGYLPILFFNEHLGSFCLTINYFAGNVVDCIHRLNFSPIPLSGDFAVTAISGISHFPTFLLILVMLYIFSHFFLHCPIS